MKKIIYTILLLIPLLTQASILSSYLPPAEMSQFIVIGDTGKQNEEQRIVANSILEVCVQYLVCDAAFLLGDNVYHAGINSPTDPKMDAVFRDFYEFLSFPFYAVLGNHDYGKTSTSLKKAKNQLGYSKINPQFVMPERFYIVEYKHVVVAFLDTTRLMWGLDYKAQKQLMKEASELAQKTGKWLIVNGHHPLLSNGDHGNAGEYERVKAPYFVSGRFVKSFLTKYVCPVANLYMSGHDHNLFALPGTSIGCLTYLVVSGAGASGSDLYIRNKVDFESSRPGYFHLSTSNDSLTLQAFDQNSNPLFSKILTR